MGLPGIRFGINTKPPRRLQGARCGLNLGPTSDPKEPPPTSQGLPTEPRRPPKQNPRANTSFLSKNTKTRKTHAARKKNKMFENLVLARLFDEAVSKPRSEHAAVVLGPRCRKKRINPLSYKGFGSLLVRTQGVLHVTRSCFTLL